MARKVLKYIVLAVVTANLALVMAVVLGGLKSKSHSLPNPNGFDDFVKAGQMLTGRPEDYKKMAKEELGDYLAKNKAALEFAHLGLSRGCRVPDDYSPGSVSRFASILPSLKSLAFALCAEGRFAEFDGDTNGAAEKYLDGMRVASESSRGGVMISKLVGIACERVARNPLQALTHIVDAGTCAKLARALESLDANEELVEDIFKQERAWFLKHTTLREKYALLWEFKSNRELRTSFINVVRKNTLQRRQLIIAFAARAYELKKGTPPRSMADLVSDYLKAIPKDPETGTNLDNTR